MVHPRHAAGARLGGPRWTSHTRLRFLALRTDAREHELATQRRIGERLAALLGCRFEVAVDPRAAAPDPAYVVPNDTIVSLDDARRFGIHGEGDLFGGVVSEPFMATKVITHPLVDHDAVAPPRWCPQFAERVRDVVLPGHSAFSIRDARIAGRRLLAGGPLRIKLAGGIGGAGQRVAADEAELDAGLAALDAGRLAHEGIVIERNLTDVRTYSVGLVRAGTMRVSYFGTQHTTRNRHGHEVYGGSSLTVVRGDFDTLERAAADADLRRAISLARCYHATALSCLPGMFASRCNYDVAQGHDVLGHPWAGVLEQSWRIGGASGAEIAALEAMRDDASLDVVRASTVEVHGPLFVPPEGATVYYAGVDPLVGAITKYAEVHRHADP
jgi:Protein of unknown function (DUF3182)/Carbamoyl-phosphate synthase L chain, ATP binding domain